MRRKNKFPEMDAYLVFRLYALKNELEEIPTHTSSVITASPAALGKSLVYKLANSCVNFEYGEEISDSFEELRYNPCHDPENGQFINGNFSLSAIRFSGGGASKDLTSSVENDTIKLEDIQIGKSLSAKATNYDILDLQTGEHFKLVEGTRLQNVEVFAGKDTKSIFRDAAKYAKRYGGNSDDWQHVKGNGVVDYYGEERQANLHWVQCEGIGKYEFFVKEWLE